jgi:hypothetical protein
MSHQLPPSSADDQLHLGLYPPLEGIFSLHSSFDSISKKKKRVRFRIHGIQTAAKNLLVLIIMATFHDQPILDDMTYQQLSIRLRMTVRAPLID